MLRCSVANAGHVLRAKKNALYSFPLLLFVQQILPECLLQARLVFGAVDMVNKLGFQPPGHAVSGAVTSRREHD